jgi:hypothetical protein
MIKLIQRALNGLDLKEYHVKHLEILNPVLPAKLTQKEIEVLAAFMALRGDVVEQDRFGTQARKIVKEQLSMSSGGLGNHLRELKDKSFIYQKDGKYFVREFLIPDNKAQGYQFKIELKNVE